MNDVVDLPAGCPQQISGAYVHRTTSEAAVIGPDRSGVYVLNDTAVALWELCDGRTTPDEMVEAVCTAFRTVREIAEDDVRRVLGELTLLGLLEWVGTS